MEAFVEESKSKYIHVSQAQALVGISNRVARHIEWVQRTDAVENRSIRVRSGNTPLSIWFRGPRGVGKRRAVMALQRSLNLVGWDNTITFDGLHYPGNNTHDHREISWFIGMALQKCPRTIILFIHTESFSHGLLKSIQEGTHTDFHVDYTQAIFMFVSERYAKDVIETYSNVRSNMGWNLTRDQVGHWLSDTTILRHLNAGHLSVLTEHLNRTHNYLFLPFEQSHVLECIASHLYSLRETIQKEGIFKDVVVTIDLVTWFDTQLNGNSSRDVSPLMARPNGCSNVNYNIVTRDIVSYVNERRNQVHSCGFLDLFSCSRNMKKTLWVSVQDNHFIFDSK